MFSLSRNNEGYFFLTASSTAGLGLIKILCEAFDTTDEQQQQQPLPLYPEILSFDSRRVHELPEEVRYAAVNQTLKMDLDIAAKRGVRKITACLDFHNDVEQILLGLLTLEEFGYGFEQREPASISISMKLPPSETKTLLEMRPVLLEKTLPEVGCFTMLVNKFGYALLKPLSETTLELDVLHYQSIPSEYRADCLQQGLPVDLASARQNGMKKVVVSSVADDAGTVALSLLSSGFIKEEDASFTYYL